MLIYSVPICQCNTTCSESPGIFICISHLCHKITCASVGAIRDWKLAMVNQRATCTEFNLNLINQRTTCQQLPYLISCSSPFWSFMRWCWDVQIQLQRMVMVSYLLKVTSHFAWYNYCCRLHRAEKYFTYFIAKLFTLLVYNILNSPLLLDIPISPVTTTLDDIQNRKLPTAMVGGRTGPRYWLPPV